MNPRRSGTLAGVSNKEILECPNDDQGLVQPLMTAAGTIVFMCDSGGEVWRNWSDVGVVAPVIPRAPDWKVSGEVHVTPGTTSWADATPEP